MSGANCRSLLSLDIGPETGRFSGRALSSLNFPELILADGQCYNGS